MSPDELNKNMRRRILESKLLKCKMQIPNWNSFCDNTLHTYKLVLYTFQELSVAYCLQRQSLAIQPSL